MSEIEASDNEFVAKGHSDVTFENNNTEIKSDVSNNVNSNEGNENYYEKDGFVVSDGSASDESENERDDKTVRRKRKRLKKRIPRLDDDDLELIKENLTGRSSGDVTSGSGLENKRLKSLNEHDVLSVDSEGMDEFIVDNTFNSKTKGKEREDVSKKNSAEIEFAEEQNKEFVELFGYTKNDYEDLEIDRNHVKRIEEDVYNNNSFKYTELATNFLLDTDKEICSLDVPERIQLKEKSMGLRRDCYNRGEFYFRFKLSEVNTEQQLRNSIFEQRIKQAKWIFFKLISRDRGTVDSNSSFKEVQNNLLFILQSLQVSCYEPGFIFVYHKMKIGPFSLNDLFEIQSMAYEYIKFMQAKDEYISLIEKLIPGHFDTLNTLNVSKDLSIKESDIQTTLDKLCYGDKLVDPILKKENRKLIERFYPPNMGISVDIMERAKAENLQSSLKKNLECEPEKLSLRDIHCLTKLIIYFFGSQVSQKIQNNIKKTKSSQDEDSSNSLFGDETDDESSVVKTKPSFMLYRSTRNAFSLSIINFPDFYFFCDLIAYIPFVCKNLKNHKETIEVARMASNIPQTLICNPYKVCASILNKDKANLFRNNLKDLYQKCFIVLSKKLIWSTEFRHFARDYYTKFVLVSTKPGSNFKLLFPDFGNEYLGIACIDRKPFKEFKESVFSTEFLQILKAEKAQIISLIFNLSNEDELLPGLEEHLETIILSESGSKFIDNREAAGLEYNPIVLESEGFFWDALRLRFLSYFVYQVVKPWMEKEIRRDLRESAEKAVCHQIYEKALSEYFMSSLRLPYYNLSNLAKDYTPKGLVVHPNSSKLRVLSMFISDARYDIDSLNQKELEIRDIGVSLILSGKGTVLSKYYLPSLIEMDKLKRKVEVIIQQEGPHFVIFNADYGVKCRHLFFFLEQLSVDASNNAAKHIHIDINCEHNPYKFFVPLTFDGRMAVAVAHAEYIQLLKKHTELTIGMNELKARAMGMFRIDPSVNLAKLFSLQLQQSEKHNNDINNVLSIVLHPLQTEIPKAKLFEVFENFLLSYIAINGLNLSDLLKAEPTTLQSVLQFVPGFGPRKAKRLINRLQRMDTPLKSRLQLKSLLTSEIRFIHEVSSTNNVTYNFPSGITNLLGVVTKLGQVPVYENFIHPGCIYENSIGFLFVSNYIDTHSGLETRYIFNPLDKTRIHPKDYKLVCLLCWMVNYNDKPMPKFVSAKLSVALQVQDDINFEEEEVLNNNDTAKQVSNILDRDDFFLDSQLISVINNIVNSAEDYIFSKEPCFVEKVSNECFNAFITNNIIFSGLAPLVLNINQSTESIKFTIDEYLDIFPDCFQDKDIFQVVSVANCNSNINDLSSLYSVMFAIHELRFPMLPIKRALPVDSKSVLFDKFFGNEFIHVKLGSLISATIFEFTSKGIHVRLSNGFKSFISSECIPKFSERSLATTMNIENQIELFYNQELGLFLNDVISVWVSKIEKENFIFECTLIEIEAFNLVNFHHDRFTNNSLLKKVYNSYTMESTKNDQDRSSRRITHPDFFNLTPNEFSNKMKNLKVGQYFFKPSSKGLRYLSLYWKVTKNRFNNQIVKEFNKTDNDLELGKKLQIGTREFDDLDDIVANFISPINSFLSELVNYTKHYRDTTFEQAARLCQQEKKKKRDIIPYFMIPDEKSATLFHFVFQPSRSVYKVSFVVKPEGFVLDKDTVLKKFSKLLQHLKSVILRSLKATKAKRNKIQHVEAHLYSSSNYLRNQPSYPNSYRR